ncbi:hypothetical protein M3Y94_00872000 [Aphelenchoides besseyi]|nr:hypothetical protein M3Y94_00872000 [Aphelenchoides besseyi]KAI6226640.1 hypothetical protein M3Y95_00641900 [Aphelenchoides besseyi]
MASSACIPTICSTDSSINRRPREKRCHHQNAHMRPVHRPNDNKQRKLREKRRPMNIVGTDNTTSGDEGDTKNESENDVSNKLEQLLRRSNQLNSDLEADCEDNNSTDVDTISVSGSINNADKDVSLQSFSPKETTMHMLSKKVDSLEKQLATVLQLNLKLKEENEQLKKMVVNHN